MGKYYIIDTSSEVKNDCISSKSVRCYFTNSFSIEKYKDKFYSHDFKFK